MLQGYHISCDVCAGLQGPGLWFLKVETAMLTLYSLSVEPLSPTLILSFTVS